MKEKNATLTGFRLQLNGQTHTAPSASPKAKFPSTAKFTLNHRRRCTQALLMNGEMKDEQFTNYTVTVKDVKMTFWIDNNTGDSWLQIEEAK